MTLGRATASNPLTPEEFRDAFFGFQFTQAIYVAAKLGLADHLEKQGKRCGELAEDIGADANALRHLLPLLVTVGIVTVDDHDAYHLTPLGSSLRTGAPNSVLGLVLSARETYRAWGNLLYSVQTGKAAFDQTFQMDMYAYLARDEEANANFNRWMEETSRDWLFPALEQYDFSRFAHFVDVGGGGGALTAEILTRQPNARATLFDLAHVVRGAEKLLTSRGVNERCTIREGDFFESVPTGCDLVIVSRVLLNWDDRRALEILENCRAAMDRSSRLLLIDFMLPARRVIASEWLTSLHLLVLGGQLMRTEEDYLALLLNAGFQSTGMIRTGGPINFIEAAPT